MSIQTFFKSLTSTSLRRRPNRRRPPASRLRLEPLEDRRLLSFSPALSYPVGDDPRTAVAGDFNGDDAPDLAVVGTSGGVRVLLGNGDGTLQAASDFPPLIHGLDMAAGDLNGDGALDLTVVDVGGSLRVLLGNGDGSFQAAPTAYLDGANSVAVGDMNADGTLDLVVGGSRTFSGSDEYGSWSATFGEINVLLGHGDGTFSPATSMLRNHFPGDIALTDLNRDGNLDVAFAGASIYAAYGYGSELQIFLGTGDGGLQYGAGYAIDSGSSLAAADFNADGTTDLAVPNYKMYTADPATLSLFLGQGDGTFQAPTTFASGASGGGGAAVAVADFNRDGRPDIAVAREYSDRANVLLGLGDGTFRDPEEFVVGSSPVDLVVVDFDGDGFADLATLNGGYNGSDETAVLLNDGVWTFLPPPPPPPTASIGDVTVTEGNTGTRAASFSVTLSAAYSQTVTVGYFTMDGTAAAGSDYQTASSTLTFAPGETSKTITVLVNGDRFVEPNETFFVNLSGATNATIADGQGVATIVDDEPRISISDVTKKEGNGKKTTLFIFTVTLSAAYDQPVTMSYRTVDGTATTSDGDYVAKTGTLTFAPGETTKTITIEVKGDSKKEANETFYLDLFGLSSNALFTKNRGLGTILNDD